TASLGSHPSPYANLSPWRRRNLRRCGDGRQSRLPPGRTLTTGIAPLKGARTDGHSEVEQRVEAYREARLLTYAANREQDARHVRGPVVRVVADRERLARRPQHDLVMRDQAADAQRVHPNPTRTDPASRPF